MKDTVKFKETFRESIKSENDNDHEAVNENSNGYLNINGCKHNQWGTNIQRDMANIRITHLLMYGHNLFLFFKSRID